MLPSDLQWIPPVSDNESDFSYLSDGSEDGWVLVQGALDGYGIVNKKRMVALVVDDDALYARLTQRMLQAKCEILNAADLSQRLNDAGP